MIIVIYILAIASLALCVGAVFIAWEFFQGYLCKNWSTCDGIIVQSKFSTLVEKIGQFFVTILGAVIGNVIGGAVGAAFYPGAAVAVSMMLNFILSILLVEFATIYFTSLNRKYRPLRRVVFL